MKNRAAVIYGSRWRVKKKCMAVLPHKAALVLHIIPNLNVELLAISRLDLILRSMQRNHLPYE